MKRAFFDLLIFLIILFLPWWISAFLLLAGLFLFKNYYEFLVFGLVVFTLYMTPSERMMSSSIYYFIVLISVFAVAQIIKENIIFYKK